MKRNNKPPYLTLQSCTFTTDSNFLTNTKTSQEGEKHQQHLGNQKSYLAYSRRTRNYRNTVCSFKTIQSLYFIQTMTTTE